MPRLWPRHRSGRAAGGVGDGRDRGHGHVDVHVRGRPWRVNMRLWLGGCKWMSDGGGYMKRPGMSATCWR